VRIIRPQVPSKHTVLRKRLTLQKLRHAHLHRPSPETIRGYARYVLGILDKADVHSFHLLGHSMGGMIAQEIVSCAPDRVEKLILYGTGACGTMPGRFETIQASKARLNAHGVTHCARRICASWFVQGVDSSAYYETVRMAEQTRS